MRIASNHPLNRTLALRRTEVAHAAVAAIQPPLDVHEFEGLAEIVFTQSPAKLVLAAIDKLKTCESPLADEAFVAALRSSFTAVRVAAVQALCSRKVRHQPVLLNLLRDDHSWNVRREVVRCLFGCEEPPVTEMLCATNDPHWRVRHALIASLLSLYPKRNLPETVVRYLESSNDPRVQGVLGYLRFRIEGAEPEAFPAVPAPEAWCEFWSWDAAVLARRLGEMGREGRRDVIETMPHLAAHDEERVRRWALKSLNQDGMAPQFAALVALLDEPRRPALPEVRKFLARLDLDRVEATALFIEDQPSPTPAQQRWAAEYGRKASDAPSLSPTAAPTLDGEERSWHPHVRAASLTEESARQLVDDPTQETSWHVLERACRLAKTPVWRIEPETLWQPPPAESQSRVRYTITSNSALHTTSLGPAKLSIAPLGVSGHYGLPAAGFARAMEAGVNLMFWENDRSQLNCQGAS